MLRERIAGLHRAIVVDNDDAEGLMRIRVQIPSLLGESVSNWAWPSIPNQAGQVAPDVQSPVWVAFEDGDIDRPVWMGTWLPTRFPNAPQTPQNYILSGGINVFPTASAVAFAMQSVGDSFSRFEARAGGELRWGSGAAAADTYLRREGDAILRVSTHLRVDGMSSFGFGAFPLNARLFATTAEATQVGIVVRGAASQSANLQEWQNSAGSMLTAVDANGALTMFGGNPVILAPTGTLYLRTSGATDINIQPNASGLPPAVTFSGSTGTATFLNIPVLPPADPSNANHATRKSYVDVRDVLMWRGVDDHSAFSAGFNEPTDFGPRYIQGTANGPGIAGAGQYYNWGMGLGVSYPYAQYVMQMAMPRTPLGGAPILSVRFREGGTWGSWATVQAAPSNDADIVHKAGTETITGSKTFTSPLYATSDFQGTYGVHGGGLTTSVSAMGTASWVASLVGMVVRGAVGQTANLQEWQNSAGTVLLKVNQEGDLVTGYAGASWQLNGGFMGGTLNVLSRGTGNIGIVARGVSGQTADLQQWQDSNGSPLTRVLLDGSLNINRVDTAVVSAGSPLGVQAIAGFPGVVIRGQVSQTADLQQWQDSAGTRMAWVASDGVVGSPQFRSYYYVSPVNTGAYLHLDNSIAYILQRTSTAVGLVVQGAASQTANLLEIRRNDGYLQTLFDSTGRLVIGSGGQNPPYGVFGAAAHPGTILTSLYVTPAAVGWTGITVRGMASQTATLQEWQNSAGTAIASVQANGDFVAQYIFTNSGLRVGEIYGDAGLYRATGAMKFSASSFAFHDASNVARATLNSNGLSLPGNLYLTGGMMAGSEWAIDTNALYFRSHGYTGGFYCTYGGGGIYMADTSFIKFWDKNLQTGGVIRASQLQDQNGGAGLVRMASGNHLSFSWGQGFIYFYVDGVYVKGL